MARPSYSEWLAKYGQEDCAGCEYNIIAKARCTYPGKYCARFVNWASRLDQKKVRKFTETK